MQTSLIINSTDTNGVAKAKAISNINSEATNEQLGEFAQKLTALTTNEYQGASRVIKMDVTEEYSGGGGTTSGKQVPTLAILKNAKNDLTITYDGDGTPYVFPDDVISIRHISGTEYSIEATDTIAGIVYVFETDNYYSACLSFEYKSDGPT